MINFRKTYQGPERRKSQRRHVADLRTMAVQPISFADVCKPIAPLSVTLDGFRYTVIHNGGIPTGYVTVSVDKSNQFLFLASLEYLETILTLNGEQI